jgi:hypothetical protein
VDADGRITEVTTNAVSGGVSSLNGLTGALNGVTFISTTSIPNGSSSVNLGSIPSGYKEILVKVDFTTNATAGALIPGFRYSTDNGASYISTSSYHVGIDVNFTAAIFYQSLSTGSQVQRTQATGVICQPNTATLATSTFESGTFQPSGSYRTDMYTTTNPISSEINALQFVKTVGTKVFAGGSITLWGRK